MIGDVQHALSRALAFCCADGSFEIEKLLHRITWELHHVSLQDFAAVAFVMRRGDGSFFVGRSRDHQALPAETLLGLLVEHDGQKLACRVKDHALDSVRFIDNRFRTSILVRVEVPQGVVATRDAALWFGLSSGASPEAVGEAEGMGREFSQWFGWYGDVIAASMRGAEERNATRARIDEMAAVLHDARAPLAVVRYLLKSEGWSGCDRQFIERELVYLERLLAECAPTKVVAHDEVSDVREVVRRVYSRYQRERTGHAVVQYEGGYDAVFARISDLDLERVVTNILGNAVRYGDRVIVSIQADESEVAIDIRDNGRGFSKHALDALARGDAFCGESESSGWGIGLASCKAKLEKLGGGLLISSQEGVGTLARIQLKQASPPLQNLDASQVAEVSPTRPSYAEASGAFIVDDDSEQAESLARVLGRYGLRARVFSSLDSMLRELEGVPPSFILCDGHMPGGGAERLLSLFRARTGAPVVSVMSGDASDDQQYRLAALGARAFFTKPVAIEELLSWANSLTRGPISSVA